MEERINFSESKNSYNFYTVVGTRVTKKEEIREVR